MEKLDFNNPEILRKAMQEVNNEPALRLPPRGLAMPNTTQTPNELIDFFMPFMTESEYKTVSYIVRKTFGYSKSGDAISISQMEHGTKIIHGPNKGQYQDLGTGLSRESILTGCYSLENYWQLIETLKEKGKTTFYRLIQHEGISYKEAIEIVNAALERKRLAVIEKE